MDHATGCSTLEDLAALAEGRLRGAERERVVEHLTGCADCREVLAESLETDVDPPRKVLSWPFRFLPSGGPARAVAGLAAAALVAVGAVPMWQAKARRSPPDRSELLAAMPAAELAPHVWGGVVMRGEGSSTEGARQAIEIGALLVDVDVALAAGNTERAGGFLHRIATLCDDAGVMDECVSNLRAIAESSDAPTMKKKLAAYLPQLERDLRDRFDGFFLDLGTFLDEALVAARTGRADFLDTRHAQRYLDRVLSQNHPGLADRLLDRLEADDAEAARDDRETRRRMLEPVRDELLVLRDSKASVAARGDAAEQVLNTLTG